MYIGCILPVSIYMCTIRLIELKLLGKTLNQYHEKCMRFSAMQLVSHCYTAVLYEPISRLKIYKNSAVYLSDVRITLLFFFCKVEELRKPRTLACESTLMYQRVTIFTSISSITSSYCHTYLVSLPSCYY